MVAEAKPGYSDRWISFAEATRRINEGQDAADQVSEDTVRRRLKFADQEARKQGGRILRQASSRRIQVSADGLRALLRTDPDRLECAIGNLHALYDEIERKTKQNQQAIRELKKQLETLRGRLDRIRR